MINKQQLEKYIYKAKRRLLKMHFEANAGHLGSNLSALEIIITLFHTILDEKDKFVLSKGHAAGLLYIALWSLGILSNEDLKSFGQEGSFFPAHPHLIPPLPILTSCFNKSFKLSSFLCFPTGSLGHGFSLSCGLALAAKQQKAQRHIWCLCGDGEWQEGSCWEALTFAVHHKLDNLTLLIDQNKLQGIGTTMDIASINDFKPRLTSFGAHTICVDGHDPNAIIKALHKNIPKGKPRAVILHTIKGNGLQNAGEVSCHYLPPTKEEYKKLLKNTNKVTLC